MRVLQKTLEDFFPFRKLDLTLTYVSTFFTTFSRMKLLLCMWLAWIIFKPKILPHYVTFWQRPEPRLMPLTLMAILHYISVAYTAYQIRPKYWYVRPSFSLFLRYVSIRHQYSNTCIFPLRWITVLISKKGPALDTRPSTFAPTTIEWAWPAFFWKRAWVPMRKIIRWINGKKAKTAK